MLKRFTLLIAIGFCSSVLATPPIPPAPTPTPSSYPDVAEIKPPIISLRSLNTGEPVSNRSYDRNDPKEVQWRLVDAIVKNRRFVQFRVIDKEDRCLVGEDGGNLPCTQIETLFNLIPTDTGAFILTEPNSGKCFTSENYGSYGYQNCLQTGTENIPLKHLWIIAPPFGQSKLLSN
ncbi:MULTISPECIES: toxin [Glaesserella]|uniref:Toxin n=1 Tax=Glaesserella australis TaxID=2094024 RepID=A0A328BXU7_9PAST|nr:MULTISPECIES: toxin [Glaesserella]AUI65713.1 toxin [Glaesserella sp. 15-184]RAL19003.1 toxin [Glaesserella australis]